MNLPPFLLNEWLESFHSPRFNLAGSTGPRWTLRQLLELGDEKPDLDALPLSYAPPEGHPKLRAAIGAYYGVDGDWVVVTNGASEAIALLLNALSRGHGQIILPFPGYPAFAGMAQGSNLSVSSYRLDRETGFRPDVERILDLAGAGTVLVIANSPHNPTGAMLRRGDCIALASALRAKGVPLLVDEVFHPIYLDDANESAAGIDNVIVVGDMSKAFSMPGLRIGWIIDSDPARRARIITARSYFSVSGSPILETLALHALIHREAILGRTKAVASVNLASLASFMEACSDILDWVPPQAGMLAFPWFRDGRETRPLCIRLGNKGVFVAPGDCFGMPEHLRIGFGSQVDGIEPALEIIAAEMGLVA